MQMDLNLKFWLEQQSLPANMPGANPVPSQAGGMSGGPPAPTSVTSVPEQPHGQQEDIPDVSSDPQVPDMSDEEEAPDFEEWKTDFFKLSVKGDTPKMLDSIGQIRDGALNAPQRKFVEDNVQVLLCRQDANVEKASREIRKLIKQELDRNHPAVSVMQHVVNTLDSYPLLNNILIKLAGMYALKGDLHRKFIAALTGSVQSGGAGNKLDLIYAETDYSINFSTRFHTSFGEISIGAWSLQEDDPEKYLSEPEMSRLQEGSPEEKQVLRNRVVLESIAEKFRNRAFLIHVVDPADGKVVAIGWDFAESLQAGYREGKLVVRQKKSEFRDAMIDDHGQIVPVSDYTVLYRKDNKELNNKGVASKEEVPFMERKYGKLYLTASADILEELASNMNGIFMKEIPYQGNPSDLRALMRCVPSIIEILMRRC